MKNTKQIQREHERDARGDIPKIPHAHAKKTTYFKKPRAKSRPAAKPKQNPWTQKAKRMARSARATIEKYRTDFRMTKAQVEKAKIQLAEDNVWITKNIKTEEDYERFKRQWSKRPLENKLHLTVTTMKSPIAPDGRRLTEPVMTDITVHDLSNERGAARVVNKLLDTKVAVRVHIKDDDKNKGKSIIKMRHVSTEMEAASLDIIASILTGASDISGADRENEFFKISSEWDDAEHYYQLGQYIRFKKIKVNEDILEEIINLAQLPFTNKQMYKEYRQTQVDKYKKLSGLDDDTIAKMAKFFNDDLLWKICARDVEPSSDIAKVHDEIYDSMMKLRDLSIDLFDDIARMIEREDDVDEIRDKINNFIRQARQTQGVD